MPAHDNLRSGTELQDIRRRLSQLERATPLASASVERGRLRFYAGSELLIQDSNFTVSGTANITGTFEGSGTFNWTGPATYKGPFTVDGDAKITKTLDVTASTRLRGRTTLEDDLVVDSNGRILVGGMTIGHLPGGDGIQFSNGGRMMAVSSGVGFEMGTSEMFVDGNTAALRNGSAAIYVDGNGSYITNLPTTPNAPNLYIDGNGRLYRSTGGTVEA